MIALLEYAFFRQALYAALFAGVACGVIGVYVVVKKFSFISGGIAHCALGGVGVGYFLGINPMLTVLPFSILSAVGMGMLSRGKKVSEDAAVSIFWAAAMALGIVFAGLRAGYTPDFFGYLFGNILTVSVEDLWLMAFLDITILLATTFLYKEFLAFSFDEEYAEATGMPVKIVQTILLCLIALTIVVLLRIVGIVLVIALLTIPGVIAKQWTFHLGKMMLIAVALSIVFTVAGLYLSYVFDIASGATIILVATFGFFLSWPLRRVFADNAGELKNKKPA